MLTRVTVVVRLQAPASAGRDDDASAVLYFHMKVVAGEQPHTDEWRGLGGVRLDRSGLTIPVNSDHADIETDCAAVCQGRLAACDEGEVEFSLSTSKRARR